MMTQTFMPTNTSAPYGPGGAPQLPQQQQNLVTSIQQHNQAQRGAAQQQISWALSKAEKKNYNNIFRSWDAQNTGFISGPTALEVFGASGLPKDDLARIWYVYIMHQVIFHPDLPPGHSPISMTVASLTWLNSMLRWV